MSATFYRSVLAVLVFLEVSGTFGSTNSQRCNLCQTNNSSKSFPQCVQSSVTCQANHVCSIIYKPDTPLTSYLTVGCTSDCFHYTTTLSSRCSYGGGITAFNTCYLCCRDYNCHHNFARLAKSSLPTTIPAAATTTLSAQLLFCPLSCATTDLSTCQSRGRSCLDTQYCNLVFNAVKDQIEGMCVDQAQKSVCDYYNTNHHCPFSVDKAHDFFVHHSNLQGYCYLGCCLSNTCVQTLLSLKGSSFQPTRTTIKTTPTLPTPTTTTTTLTTHPTTTQSTTRTTSTTMSTTHTTISTYFNYTSLLTSCADKLKGSTCAILRDTQDMCTKSDAVALCAQTCNVCQMVKAVKCEDKTTGNDCIDLVSKPGFCQSKMAIYICPKSCGLCNEMIKTVVKEVISASPTPDFNHPSFTVRPRLHCKELVLSQCEHVKAVCNFSNLKDVCPQECQACSH